MLCTYLLLIGGVWGLLYSSSTTALSPSTASTLLESDDLDEALKESDVVFSGEVTDLVQDQFGKQATLTVIHAWKGKFGKRVIVGTGTTGDDFGYDFDVGQRYLIYGQNKGKHLWTSTRMRTLPLDQAVPDLRELFIRCIKSSPNEGDNRRDIMRVTVDKTPLVFEGRPPKVDYLTIGTDLVVPTTNEQYAFPIRDDKIGYMYKSHLTPTGEHLVKYNKEWIPPSERDRRWFAIAGLVEYQGFWITPVTRNEWRSQNYQDWLWELKVNAARLPTNSTSSVWCPPANRYYFYTPKSPSAKKRKAL